MTDNGESKLMKAVRGFEEAKAESRRLQGEIARLEQQQPGLLEALADEEVDCHRERDSLVQEADDRLKDKLGDITGRRLGVERGVKDAEALYERQMKRVARACEELPVLLNEAMRNQ